MLKRNSHMQYMQIGKQGRIAKAIRAMVKAAASRTDKKVIVEIEQ